jgi:hypothetical protein
VISFRLTGLLLLPLTMAEAGVSAARDDAARPGCRRAAATAPARPFGRDDARAAPIQTHTAVQRTFSDLD